MFTEEQIPELLAQLTLEEKCSLLSGSDFWHTQPVERLGIPALMDSDGPHGLRKQAVGADEMGLEESVPATCFPTAAALASTWDVVLLEEIGRALAEEAKAQGVGVILGPGVNLNRMRINARIDERALREMYLSIFERIIERPRARNGASAAW